MGHTLLCVLGLFSLNLLLHCGHAQDAVLTIEPNWSTFFTGESVTFICDMREREDTDWYYRFMKDGREFLHYNSHKRFTLQPVATGDSGEYQCQGYFKSQPDVKRESNKVSLTVSDKHVILQTPASTLFEGESVTLRCRHRNQTKEKNAAFYKDGSLIEIDTNHQSPMISKNTVQLMSDGSSYTCKCDEDEESDPIKLRMKPKPKAQLSASRRDILAGGNVTLTCSVRPSSSGWKYFWYRGNKISEPLTTNGQIRVSQRGLYWCRGGRGDPAYYTEYSDPVVTNRAVVIPQPNWPEIYSGEMITLTCVIEDGGDAEWEYAWTPSSYTPQNPSEHMIRPSDGRDYRCYGTMKSEKSSTEWSKPLRVSSSTPWPVLTVSPLWLSPGDSVTLNCNVTHPSAGWRFYWYKAVPKLADNSYSYELLPGSINGTEQDSYIVHGQTHTARYVCRAGRGDPVFHSDYSEPTFVWSGDFHSAASLTVSPDRAQHFENKLLSLSCEGNSTKWRVIRFSEYGSLIDCTIWGTMTGSTCTIDRTWLSGVYWCESETGQFSNAVNITIQYDGIILVSPVHPVAEGRPVTLGCKLKTEKVLHDVDFYKNDKLIKNHTNGELIITAVSKSDEGFYRCKGKESPESQWIRTSRESWMSVKHAVLTIEPNWSTFFTGESVNFICDMRDREDTDWYYRFMKDGDEFVPYSQHKRYTLQPVATRDSGEYQCQGYLKGPTPFIKESTKVSLTVSEKPQPVLTVSPLWLSPGDSVTLNCSVRGPSAGWRFYWYKAVPKQSNNSYSYELLPGSIDGTEQDSYIVHGQTHTAGYVCRAGRGDPVFHSDYSKPKFVWSGDFHSAASLTVSPDRAQHFENELVSLSCEGNSIKWRVSMFYESGSLVPCTSLGTMTGSTCTIDRIWLSGVYWCESETGQFSNAVNITIPYDDIILVSPVHPVAEGRPVTLGCKLKTEKVLHDVDFYKNDKLIKNHTNGELNITAVSKSDEGFYRCKGKESPESQWIRTSKESWISVKHVPASEPEKSSPFPVMLIVGLVCGVLLIILLLLSLYCYRKSKDSCFKRSQSTNQGPATDHMINQDETQSRVYASLLHGDLCLYETIQGAEEPGNGENNEPEESVYSNVTTRSAADQ